MYKFKRGILRNFDTGIILYQGLRKTRGLHVIFDTIVENQEPLMLTVKCARRNIIIHINSRVGSRPLVE